jgi:hypothetical protein
LGTAAVELVSGCSSLNKRHEKKSDVSFQENERAPDLFLSCSSQAAGIRAAMTGQAKTSRYAENGGVARAHDVARS